MIFPKTGRVIIVDDRIQEAQIVMESLSKSGIPYSYLQGNPKNLPDPEDLVDMRLLILDLNLEAEAISKTESAEKNFKGRMYALLSRIIKKGAVYMLVVWGKEEDAYYKFVQELFESQLSDRKPFREFSLQKSDYFDLNGNQIDSCPDPIKEISGRIEQELQTIPTYQLLSEWENSVHRATNETIESFNDLLNDLNRYEQEASALIASLSKAYLGQQYRKVEREERKLEAALLALNELFADSLESTLLAKNSILAKPVLPNSSQQVGYRAKVNNQILISNDTTDKQYPGIVYKVEPETVYRSILSDALNRSLIREENFNYYNDEHLEGEQLLKAKKKAQERFDKKYRKDRFEESMCIELHITPLCDYAQDKVKCARILKGLMVPVSLHKYLNHKTEFLYVSEFPFDYQDSDYHFLLDFRYLHSINPELLNSREAHFRIRHQWVVDIQSRLSRHVNRPGILYL